MRNRQVGSLGLLFAGILFSPTVLAQDVGNLVYHLAGSTTPSGKLRVTIEVGAFVTHALRVVSEPSGTLQLTLVDIGFSNSSVGTAWLKEKGATGSPLIATSLPMGQPAVEIPTLPPGDNVLAVWVYGTWPGGTDEDRLVGEARVNPRRFDFSSSMVATAVGFQEIWCCRGGVCDMQCVECPRDKFTCCLSDSDPGCCYITCGWEPCPC